MYVPPLMLKLDHGIYGRDELPGFAGVTAAIPYRHDDNNFKISIKKWLSPFDVNDGYLTFLYSSFDDDIIAKGCGHIELIDDLGHYWLMKLSFDKPDKYVKFLGDWVSFCNARKLCKGRGIKLGAKAEGRNYVLYVALDK